MEASDLTKAAMNTVEAAADALLTAAAMLLMTEDIEPSIGQCKFLAIGALDSVIAKTQKEGARP